jgi:hypothetical protein
MMNLLTVHIVIWESKTNLNLDWICKLEIQIEKEFRKEKKRKRNSCTWADTPVPWPSQPTPSFPFPPLPRPNYSHFPPVSPIPCDRGCVRLLVPSGQPLASLPRRVATAWWTPLVWSSSPSKRTPKLTDRRPWLRWVVGNLRFSCCPSPRVHISLPSPIGPLEPKPCREKGILPAAISEVRAKRERERELRCRWHRHRYALDSQEFWIWAGWSLLCTRRVRVEGMCEGGLVNGQLLVGVLPPSRNRGREPCCLITGEFHHHIFALRCPMFCSRAFMVWCPWASTPNAGGSVTVGASAFALGDLRKEMTVSRWIGWERLKLEGR